MEGEGETKSRAALLKEEILLYWGLFRQWLAADPLHWLPVIWIVLVVIDGAILFMLLVTWLDRYFTPVEKDAWIEGTSQFMNALFTISALVTHPSRLRHLYMYFTNRSKLCDERGHPPNMPEGKTLAVVLLFNMNNFAQYVLAGFMWGYIGHHAERSPYAVAFSLIASFGAVIAAALLESKWIKEYSSAEHYTESVPNA